MRILGIDYGKKRIGLALSDENGILAFPYKTLLNDKNILKQIEDILEKEQITEIVIGKSEDNLGGENKISFEIENFRKELSERFQIPIQAEKEFFTSMHAHGTKGKEVKNARQSKFKKIKDLDASASALILQRYLDRK